MASLKHDIRVGMDVFARDGRWLGVVVRVDDDALAVGRWWGLVGRLRVPLPAVDVVSLERVIVRVACPPPGRG
jgi:hypothetical protein